MVNLPSAGAMSAHGLILWEVLMVYQLGQGTARKRGGSVFQPIATDPIDGSGAMRIDQRGLVSDFDG